MSTWTGRKLRRILWRVSSPFLGTVTHVRTSEPVAALTFDDGPHPEFTPELLGILAKHDAKATFFMLGISAQRHPEIVRHAAQAGHAVCNHSWDHPSFPTISGRARRKQIRDCAKVLGNHGDRLFRPPFGHQTILSRLDALLLGYQAVTWNVGAKDWLEKDVSWLVNTLVNRIRPGCIVVLHDALYQVLDKACENRRPVLEALDQTLKILGRRFRFVTVPELLTLGRAVRELWIRHPDPNWLKNLQLAQYHVTENS